MKPSLKDARIAHAQRTYWFALLITAACSSPALISSFLLATGQQPEVSLVTAASALPIISCLQFVRDSNERVDRLLADMLREVRDWRP